MSASSERGKKLELVIASMLRKKLGAKVERDKRSGAGINRADISDYWRELPIHIEAKNQEKINLKAWFRQADDASSSGQAPTVVFKMDEEILACLRLNDLIDLLVEIKDCKQEIALLRSPTKVIDKATLQGAHSVKGGGIELDYKIEKSHKECRNGHLCDEYGYCQTKGCKFMRGYRPTKSKK